MLPLSLLVFVLSFLAGSISALPTKSGLGAQDTHDEETKLPGTPRGYDIPIHRRHVRRSGLRRRQTASGQSGLGDNMDL